MQLTLSLKSHMPFHSYFQPNLVHYQQTSLILKGGENKNNSWSQKRYVSHSWIPPRGASTTKKKAVGELDQACPAMTRVHREGGLGRAVGAGGVLNLAPA